jgi:hypothetical protein
MFEEGALLDSSVVFISGPSQSLGPLAALNCKQQTSSQK